QTCALPITSIMNEPEKPNCDADQRKPKMLFLNPKHGSCHDMAAVAGWRGRTILVLCEMMHPFHVVSGHTFHVAMRAARILCQTFIAQQAGNVTRLFGHFRGLFCIVPAWRQPRVASMIVDKQNARAENRKRRKCPSPPEPR